MLHIYGLSFSQSCCERSEVTGWFLLFSFWSIAYGIDRWLYWLKHLPDAEALPEALKKTIFEDFFNIAEYTNLSKEERKMYDQDLKRKRDNAAAEEYVRQTAKLEGFQEGENKGIEKGVELGVEKVARNLKRNGMSIEAIIENTGLTSQQIKKL